MYVSELPSGAGKIPASPKLGIVHPASSATELANVGKVRTAASAHLSFRTRLLKDFGDTLSLVKMKMAAGMKTTMSAMTNFRARPDYLGMSSSKSYSSSSKLLLGDESKNSSSVTASPTVAPSIASNS